MGVIEDKIRHLPENPGVYVMLDKNGQIIYVGKAKNLKNRVRQYFFNGVKTAKVMAMVNSIADFYYIIAPSEIDALSLENNLIKTHKPRYNILLKDDKTYPYLKIDLKEPYPALRITRKIKKDGARYFGPFMGGISVNDVLSMTNLIYGLRPCDKALDFAKTSKPCLNYHIGKCPAPCAGNISEAEYLKNVNSAVAFLSGDVSGAETIMRRKMTEYAKDEKFELALKYRQGLEFLDKIKIKRLTSLNKFVDMDVISYRSDGIYSAVNVLFIRAGRMLGGKNFSFESAALTSSDALSEFIARYYKAGKEIPEEIVVGEEIGDYKVLEEYLKTRKGKAVRIIFAKQGLRKQLADMAEVNAEEHLSVAVDKIKHKDDMTVKACQTLKEKLGLKNYPKRMECYDISHISGVDRVGSMAVFIDGEPAKSEYRRFKIKTFEGNDDFRSLKEVLARRIERLSVSPETFPKPDLIIIDGGKGQLSSVKEIFDEKGVTDIDLISLAKRFEEVFVPEKSDPIVFSERDYCLKLLERIRDEAHRFAITFFRSLHGKRSLSSVLDGIHGLGKTKKAALLSEFKDLSGIIKASEKDLIKVEGVGEVLAKEIIGKLTEEGLR